MSELDPTSRALMNALSSTMSDDAESGDAGGSWYHGTANRDFTAFDPNHGKDAPHGGGSTAGVFFTDSKQQADNFRRLALKYGDGAPDKSDGRVIEAMIRGKFKSVDVPALEAQRAQELRKRTSDAKPALLGRQREWMLQEAHRAKREGFDGVDFVNILDDPLSAKNRATHRVVFPERIAANIDIRHSHIQPPSGEPETTIAAAREARLTNQSSRPQAAPRATGKRVRKYNFMGMI